MMNKDQTQVIASYLKRIKGSGLTIQEFFEKYAVPFSVAQYYRYKKCFERDGLQGLRDGRAQGNHRRLHSEAASFLLGFHAANPNAKLTDYQASLSAQIDLRVDLATLSRFFRARDISLAKPKPPAMETVEIPYGGFEMIAALASHLKWPEYTARQIQQAASQLEPPPKGQPHADQTVDWRGRDSRGRFTARYNRRPDIRRNKFAAIADKRQGKDLTRLRICQSEVDTLARKALAILALPVVTLNGTLRSVNTPLGNALGDFAGYNYMDATLEKFLRELKYLGLAERFVRGQVGFWQQHWRAAGLDSQREHGPLLCYYVDGHTKALWSSKRVHKNKVTMLGRVMGCLEQVFVHDGLGRPTYFETYSGRAPWGEYVLSLFEKIEKQLKEPPPKLPVIRLLVLDGANNSVKTLRAFAAQDKYYFITTLDKNQWQPRRLRSEGPKHRYEDSLAFISDCEIELADSTDKGYLIIVRAIKIEWDDGKITVLITNLPAKILDASRVAKTYFERWPLQELWFRDAKEFGALHRVAGYGKKLLDDETVRTKQKELQEKIATLRNRLQQPFAQLSALDQQLHTWIEKERQLRVQSRVVDGQRQTNPRQVQKLDDCRRAIAAIEREKRKIRQPDQKLFNRLKRHEQEWLRLQGKEKIYKVDVELDQILTYFRVAFVNLCTYFQMKFLSNLNLTKNAANRMTLATLLHRIFLLPATVEQTEEWRRVYLKRNQKDKAMMAVLEQIVPKLNALNLRHTSGRRFEFFLK
jgi:transposase